MHSHRKSLEELENEIQLQKKIIQEQNEKISELLKLINSLKNEKKNDLVNKERKIKIIFNILAKKDSDREVLCYLDDDFVRVEEKLYKTDPMLINYENYFYANDRKVNRFKTLEENGIKNEEKITIVSNENAYI